MPNTTYQTEIINSSTHGMSFKIIGTNQQCRVLEEPNRKCISAKP